MQLWCPADGIKFRYKLGLRCKQVYIHDFFVLDRAVGSFTLFFLSLWLTGDVSYLMGALLAVPVKKAKAFPIALLVTVAYSLPFTCSPRTSLSRVPLWCWLASRVPTYLCTPSRLMGDFLTYPPAQTLQEDRSTTFPRPRPHSGEICNSLLQ